MIGDGAADAVRGASIESFLVGQRSDSSLASRVSASTPLPGVIGAIEMMREVVSRADKE